MKISTHLQNKTRIQLWLYENVDLRIEGRIVGFDEYMNLVLADAKEVSKKKKTEKELGARRPRRPPAAPPASAPPFSPPLRAMLPR